MNDTVDRIARQLGCGNGVVEDSDPPVIRVLVSDLEALLAERERLLEELAQAQCKHEELEWLGSTIDTSNVNHRTFRCKRCSAIITDEARLWS